jgi:segregation and condensation protein A
MSIVLSTIKRDQFTDFSDLFNIEEGRSGVVVTLLALLELLKQSLIELIQTDAYGPIHVKVADTAEHGTAE